MKAKIISFVRGCNCKEEAIIGYPHTYCLSSADGTMIVRIVIIPPFCSNCGQVYQLRDENERM